MTQEKDGKSAPGVMGRDQSPCRGKMQVCLWTSLPGLRAHLADLCTIAVRTS